MSLLWFITVPILLGVIIYAIPKIPIKTFVIIVETALLIYASFLFVYILQNGSIVNILGSENMIIGITLISGKLNMALIILSVLLFFLSFIYTMKESFFDKKFVMLFLILQGLLCGVFLSDDLFNIYVLLEVATIVVAILIMFKRDSRSMYDGMVYLLSQIICMIFYLFGIGYLYKTFGVLSIQKISEMMPQADASSLVLPFAFIMTAVGLKSALFPLFSWLPHAHGTPSAPSAVSAILSGLYVKNGVYLFFVFSTLFSPVIDYTLFFTFIGACTAVLGFVFALVQTDIKLILAYSTVSQIGLIVLGMSSGEKIAQQAAIYHLISHALFKSLLFLSAGMIIKQYKTRNIREIKGLFKAMPLTAFCTVLGVLGITGAPFFNSSISKYFMQYATEGSISEILILLINIGTILVFTKYSKILFGKEKEKVKTEKNKVAVLLFLASLCFVSGVFGTEIMNVIFASDLKVELFSYLEKSGIYFVMIIFAHFAYKYFISKFKLLNKLKKVSLNFQQIIMAMVAFFTLTVLVTANFVIT